MSRANTKTKKQFISKLEDILQKKEIRGLLVDMDDTLVDTHKLYNQKIKAFAKYISGNGQKTESEIFSVMRDTIRGLRGHFFVHPTLMAEAARMAALVGGVDLEGIDYKAEREELMKLYQESPPVFEGVAETLNIFKETGLKIGLITHASKEWTQEKIRVGKMDGIFDVVHCIDTMTHKDEEQWKIVVQAMDLNPGNLIIAGDSWTSDIGPALAIGVPKEQIYRVKTDYDLANKDEVKGVREIDNFIDLHSVIINSYGK